MKLIVKTMMFALAAVWLSGTSAQVHAVDKYVTDVVYVPLRAGPGNQYRILHQGLKTGARMTVLEDNAGEGFTKVRMSNGTEGFIRTQYLMGQQPARDRLPQEQEKKSAAVGTVETTSG